MSPLPFRTVRRPVFRLCANPSVQPANEMEDGCRDLGDGSAVGRHALHPCGRSVVQHGGRGGTSLDMYIEDAAEPTRLQALRGRVVGGGQEDPGDFGILPDRTSNHRALEHAYRVDVDHPMMAEGAVVAPDRPQVGLGETRSLDRRMDGIEVVTVDKDM